ncbi:MAG TPA: hypothetical protein ENF32_02455 [Thermosulfidibacter takaii]|uniref:Universal stress protein n=1 Tax=Thermosulfidibacter takaii TaxID=412593 RepID=A0A7C0Y5M9_9BACT|nr:hypothetical protein [Thermosulfidibacter takaii]
MPFDKELKEKDERVLEGAATLARGKGVNCRTLLKTGSVAENIVMAAAHCPVLTIKDTTCII